MPSPSCVGHCVARVLYIKTGYHLPYVRSLLIRLKVDPTQIGAMTPSTRARLATFFIPPASPRSTKCIAKCRVCENTKVRATRIQDSDFQLDAYRPSTGAAEHWQGHWPRCGRYGPDPLQMSERTCQNNITQGLITSF